MVEEAWGEGGASRLDRKRNGGRVPLGNRSMTKQAMLEEVLMITFSELDLIPPAGKQTGVNG